MPPRQELHRPGEDVEWVFSGISRPDRRRRALAWRRAGNDVGGQRRRGRRLRGLWEPQADSRVTTQIAGKACRLPAAAYRDLFDQSANLRTAVHKYIEVLLFEARQLVACNALHSVEARLSRLLLEALDRCRSDETVQITQETVAQMLGVQRTTIAAATAVLQRSRIIRSGRGSITVLDTPALERTCCGCRRAVQAVRTEIFATTTKTCED